MCRGVAFRLVTTNLGFCADTGASPARPTHRVCARAGRCALSRWSPHPQSPQIGVPRCPKKPQVVDYDGLDYQIVQTRVRGGQRLPARVGLAPRYPTAILVIPGHVDYGRHLELAQDELARLYAPADVAREDQEIASGHDTTVSGRGQRRSPNSRCRSEAIWMRTGLTSHATCSETSFAWRSPSPQGSRAARRGSAPASPGSR